MTAINVKREWLKTREAAEVLGLHPVTLQRFAREGLIPAARIGRSHYRFRLEDLRGLVRSGAQAPTEAATE